MKSKSNCLLITLALGLGLTLALLWLPVLSGAEGLGGAAPVAHAAPVLSAVEEPAAELHVCPSGCTYSSIQDAVDDAGDGDVIKVAAGVYTDIHQRASITQVVYVDETITIQGGYTTTNWTTPHPITQPTTLDAGGLGRGLVISGAVAPTVEGLRITGGDATGLGGGYLGRDVGGGVYVYVATPTISNCIIYSNTASTASIGQGGGLYLGYSDNAMLSGNTVISNTASTAEDGFGGGLYLGDSAAMLDGNTVQGNTASIAKVGYGGGLFLSESGATLSDNTVRGNTASTADWGHGGGLYLLYSDNATLSGNTIVSNTSSTAGGGYGGGVYLSHSAATLSGNIVQGNTASTTDQGYGGGLRLSRSGAMLDGNTVVSNTATQSPAATGRGGGLEVWRTESFTLTNNVVADNHANTKGSGLYFEGSSIYPTSGRLLHNTIADNRSSGQGVFVDEYSTLAFTNTIVAGHHSVGITVTTGSAAALEATLWYGNGVDTGGEGTVNSSTNVYGDPVFNDPAAWDYHLMAGSAAINTGVNAGVTTDIDGRSRPVGIGYDIGADEYPIGVLLTPDHRVVTGPSTVITYTHILTNTGHQTDTFALALSSTQEWAAPLTGTITLSQGATTTMQVSIVVPAGSDDMVDTTIITATSQTDSDIFDTATDVTIVGPAVGVALGPNHRDSVPPGMVITTVITYSHILTNTGNYPDTFDLTLSSTQGWATLLTDTISLAQKATATVQVRVVVPPGSDGLMDITVITATSRADPGVFDTAEDTTMAGRVVLVALEPNYSATAYPGTVVTYTHTLDNMGNHTETFTLTLSSTQDWATLLTDTITLVSEATATVQVRVTVPPGIISGTVDSTWLTATSHFKPAVFDTVTDVTTVGLAAGVALKPNRSGMTDPGTVITYTHTITNTGNVPDTFAITHASSQGWAVAYDTSIALGIGQTTTLVVSLTVPSGLISGTVDSTLITATSQADPTVSDAATDTTTVGQVAGVELAPDLSGTSTPGAVIIYTHILTNTGNGTDTFAITHTSSQGWTVAYDTPIVLSAWQTTTLVVGVTVPSDAISGTVDSTWLTATSQTNPTIFDTVTDTTTVTVGLWDIYLPIALRNCAP